MTYASQIVRHSKKIRNSSNSVWHDYVVLVRCFSGGARSLADKGDDIFKRQKVGFASLCGSSRGSAGFANGSKSVFPSVVSVVRTQKDNSMRTGSKMDVPSAGMLFSCKNSWSRWEVGRSFSTDSGLPPHLEVGMPSLSPTMTEGNIARWLKKEGDKISPGEVLCEVETDKATVEMECMEEGYLAKIIQGDGSSGIKVGEVIAITVEEEGDIAKFKDYTPSSSDSDTQTEESSSPPPPKEEVAKEPVTSTEPKFSKPSSASSAEGRIFASPLARKIAEEHKVPLSNIKGTGPDGVIVKADIEEYLASHEKGAPASKVSAGTAGAIDYTDIPHSQIRKVTASRLLLSKQTIPHYYLTVDTCVDKLMDLRIKLNSLQEASGGKRISVNDLVIKAAALALQKVPEANSSWTNDYIRQYHNVNINVAVQTDNGLYVPVIRDADKKGLSKIADEVKHLAQKAKENSLKPEDYEGGTFTVSNLDYVPLPTSLHIKWAVLAAQKKKHILLEKPVALNVKEFDVILEACESNGVQFMDATMWMHHPRTAKMREFLSDPESFGQLKSVYSIFTFAADNDFLEENIRVKPDLDALGALGDLGWYCVRSILWSADFELPKSVIASRNPVFNKSGVLIACGASLYWEDGKVATFFCSFQANLTMNLNATGTKGTLRLHDFVVPFEEDKASFTGGVKLNFNDLVTAWEPKPSEHVVTTDLPQEAQMVKEFSRLVGSIKSEGSKPEKKWPTISRKTQLILDAVKKSIEKGFVSVEVIG